MLPFKTITQACAHRDPETKLLVSEIQRVLFKNLNELEQYEARLKREYELQMKIKHETLSGGRVKVEDKLMDITSDPLLVAQQLMLIEEERLSAIGPEEFMQAFVKDDPDAEASELARSSHNLEAYVGRHAAGLLSVTRQRRRLLSVTRRHAAGCSRSRTEAHLSRSRCRLLVFACPGVFGRDRYVEWFNRLSYLVASDIIRVDKKKDRVRTLEFWLMVCHHSHVRRVTFASVVFPGCPTARVASRLCRHCCCQGIVVQPVEGARPLRGMHRYTMPACGYRWTHAALPADAAQLQQRDGHHQRVQLLLRDPPEEDVGQGEHKGCQRPRGSGGCDGPQWQLQELPRRGGLPPRC